MKYNGYANDGMLQQEDKMLFSTQTLLKITSGAALALALTACGGEGDSTAGANAAGANAASPSSALSILSKGITAFTVPGWTTFPMDISKNSDGSEILTLPDPTLGAQQVAIKSRDAQGNITEIDTSGPITSVLSLMGNRVGMICGSDHHFKPAPNASITPSGHYVYLSDDFVEIAHSELYGKTFDHYSDCKLGLPWLLDESGMINYLEEDAEPPTKFPLEIFSAEGLKDDGVVSRSKAYKHTVDGKPIYVLVDVTAIDPNMPDTDPEDQYLGVSISR